MMKHYFPIIFLVVSVLVLPSCLKNEVDFTPNISFSYFYHNPVFRGDTLVGAQDTMSMTVDEDGRYLMDTIAVGDSVTLAIGFASFANNLTAAQVKPSDTTALVFNVKLSSGVQAILSSRYAGNRGIRLEVNPGYNYLAFPMGYRPLKAGMHRIEYVVESDSKYSPTSYVFVQPVREREN